MTIQDLFQRGLNLEKLRSFLAVAQVGSVKGAARGEDSRRSLMSRQIGELERTLGFDLFQRNGRSIEITERGRELALLTASFFAEFEDIAKRGTAAETRLRIGAGASVFEALVFPRLRQLERNFAETNFEFCGFSSNEVIKAVHEGEVDLGVVRSGLNFSGISEISTGTISFVLVGRREFDTMLPAWNARKFLSRVPLTMIIGEGYWMETFQKLCSHLEIDPRIVHRAGTFGQVRELLKAGASGAILPASLAYELPESEFICIEDEILSRLTRPLSVIFDSRAGRVRDRLERMASTLAEVIR